MDMSTSDRLVVSAASVLLGTAVLEQGSITQADWEELLDGMFSRLEPRLKYIPQSMLHDVSKQVEFVKYIDGKSTSFRPGNKNLERCYEATGGGPCIRLLAIIRDVSADENAVTQSFDQALLSSRNGIVRLRASYLLRRPGLYVMESLQANTVKISQLPLTCESYPQHLTVGAAILWRLNELASAIVRYRDEMTTPFTDLMNDSASIMRRIHGMRYIL